MCNKRLPTLIKKDLNWKFLEKHELQPKMQTGTLQYNSQKCYR